MPDDPHANQVRKPAAFVAIGIFLCFGAATASVAAIPLLWPGTSLDRLWTLNPKAYRELLPYGIAPGFLFLLLGAILGVASIGWFRRYLWGWRMAVTIVAIQILGDVVNCVRGDWLAGATGALIAGAALLYLLRPDIKDVST